MVVSFPRPKFGGAYISGECIWSKSLTSSTDTKLIYLAQFHKHKRHLEIIDALSPLMKSFPSLKVYFFGDGVLFDKVQSVVSRLNLEENIYLPGRIERKYVPWVLQNSTASIVISDVETFGHNILEPLFYGSPVISTDVGIAREVVHDFESGFLIKSISRSIVKAVRFFAIAKMETILWSKHNRLNSMQLFMGVGYAQISSSI